MEKQKEITLSSLADILQGELIGSDGVINSVTVPDEQVAGSICIISDKNNVSKVNGDATAYIVIYGIEVQTDKPYIKVKDAKNTIVKLLNALYPPEAVVHNISTDARVSKSATYGNPVNIGAFVTIGNDVKIGKNTIIMDKATIGKDVIIGDDCIIYPNVTIYDNIKIGNGVIIHAGAVLGADGFGFVGGALHTKIPHKGTVIIEDFVEIGANTCVDRATIGSSVIGVGTKLDNLVQIGHNMKMGRGCLVASQVGFSGSCNVGDYVVFGGQVGISDHVKIADGSMFGGQAGVPNDVEKGSYLGSPCMPFLKYAKSFSVFQELPELKMRVKKIENKL